MINSPHRLGRNRFSSLLCLTAAALLHAGMAASLEAATSISILPLGDSITDGYLSSNAGYRTQTYSKLTSDGFTVSYLGSSTDNSSPTLTAAGQTHHEGHNGYRIDNIENNLDGSDTSNTISSNNGGHWLNNSINPNYILLHIGTNDIDSHYNPNNQSTESGFLTDLESRMTSLVNHIFADRPSVKLLVASIIPVNNSSTKLTESQTYDSWIQNTLVPQFASQGAYFVNQAANFYNGSAVRTDLYTSDNLHPTQAGYDLIGTTWANAIEATPEPGSLALIGIACVGMMRKRRAS